MTLTSCTWWGIGSIIIRYRFTWGFFHHYLILKRKYIRCYQGNSKQLPTTTHLKGIQTLWQGWEWKGLHSGQGEYIMHPCRTQGVGFLRQLSGQKYAQRKLKCALLLWERSQSGKTTHMLRDFHCWHSRKGKTHKKVTSQEHSIIVTFVKCTVRLETKI